MKEITGNLWEQRADVICITTNGFVKKNGEAVMGRGCAKEAALLYPELPRTLGINLVLVGNHVSLLRADPEWLFSFPVKHHWREKADLKLIERSAREIVAIVDKHDSLKRIVIPRPGCGNGRLKWEDVKAVLEPIFDDRFEVISFDDRR